MREPFHRYLQSIRAVFLYLSRFLSGGKIRYFQGAAFPRQGNPHPRGGLAVIRKKTRVCLLSGSKANLSNDLSKQCSNYRSIVRKQRRVRWLEREQAVCVFVVEFCNGEVMFVFDLRAFRFRIFFRKTVPTRDFKCTGFLP